MRIRNLGAALGVLALASTSCAEQRPASTAVEALPVTAALADMPLVRISEIHYDNSGGDTGERIEISGPAGASLTGWSVVLYNGSGGAVYNTRDLAGLTLGAQCGDRGVITLAYPADGIQNGSPDGIALVGPTGLVEFLSYEGTFTAVGGAANGVLSTDIGVAEVSTTPIGHSVKRNPDGTWSAPSAHSFDACNDYTAPPAEVASVDVTPASATVVIGATATLTATAKDAGGNPVSATFTWTSSNEAVATVSASGVVTGAGVGTATVTATTPNGKSDAATITVDAPTFPAANASISEFHYDNDGADVNEAVELLGTAGESLAGWKLELYTGSTGALYNTINVSGVLGGSCSAGKGVLVVAAPGLQNGNGSQNEPDGIALVTPDGVVKEFISYEGSFTATSGAASGMTSVNVGVSEPGNASATSSLQRAGNGTWFGPATNTFGSCNPAEPPVPPSTITFSGRTPSDPPLPVGFEDQIFATLRVGGVSTPTTITWLAETPDIATIDADGVIRAVGVGTARFRATAASGATNTYALPTAVATMAAGTDYDNIEFGVPLDGNPADEVVASWPQFAFSFSPSRGIPNWVSYDIDAASFGPEDRCDCFTYDPKLPAAGRYTTADYTGAGTFHGYGIDRGHLARSFDRTAGTLDNATTFYFSNIIPQAADNNQGPWAAFESYLGDLARTGGKEVYVVAGATGSLGTLKNEGRITIPEDVWKVALVLPAGMGLAQATSLGVVEAYAVVMPNKAGIRGVNWRTYLTTIDAVEALSGYDVFNLLRDDLEIALESGTKPPVAAITLPAYVLEDVPATLSGAASTDPDGDALTYAWAFGDGGTATGVAPVHAWTAAGTYTVRLIVTDTRTLADTATATIVVRSRAQVTTDAIAQVDALVAAGLLSKGEGNSLAAKLESARRQLEAGKLTPAANLLEAARHELAAMEQSGRLTDAQAAPLRATIALLLQSIALH